MRSVDSVYRRLGSNHDKIRRLISENIDDISRDEKQYNLALEVIKLQSVMMAKLANPDMKLEINAACTIEEVPHE